MLCLRQSRLTVAALGQRCGSEEEHPEVRRLIDTLGAPFGNAYVLAPSNSLMPEIPVENLVALVEACHDQ